jgi:hypothetical protein
MSWMRPLSRRNRKNRAISGRVRLALEGLEHRLVLSGDPSLTVALAPHTVAENAGPGAVTGSVTRNNMDTSQPLTVNLTSSDTSHATVPANVTIPAGAASANFGVNPVDDQIVGPTQTVTITGTAPSPVAVGFDPTFAGGVGYRAVPTLSGPSSANFPDAKVQPDGKI